MKLDSRTRVFLGYSPTPKKGSNIFIIKQGYFMNMDANLNTNQTYLSYTYFKEENLCEYMDVSLPLETIVPTYEPTNMGCSSIIISPI